MLTLHHLNNSRSQRILWLMEELALPYHITTYQRDPATLLAPAALKAIHPLGKSPVVSDGDIVVAESGAIVEYLVDTYDTTHSLKPAAGSQAARDYTYWLHYAEGSAMPPLLMSLVFSRISKPPMPALLRPLARMIEKGVRQGYIDPQLDMHLRYIDNHLASSGWFAGDSFSAADIQMSFVLEAANSRVPLCKALPHIQDFLQRIHARPAYQEALLAGGQYDYA